MVNGFVSKDSWNRRHGDFFANEEKSVLSHLLRIDFLARINVPFCHSPRGLDVCLCISVRQYTDIQSKNIVFQCESSVSIVHT